MPEPPVTACGHADPAACHSPVAAALIGLGGFVGAALAVSILGPESKSPPFAQLLIGFLAAEAGLIGFVGARIVRAWRLAGVRRVSGAVLLWLLLVVLWWIFAVSSIWAHVEAQIIRARLGGGT